MIEPLHPFVPRCFGFFSSKRGLVSGGYIIKNTVGRASHWLLIGTSGARASSVSSRRNEIQWLDLVGIGQPQRLFVFDRVTHGFVHEHHSFRRGWCLFSCKNAFENFSRTRLLISIKVSFEKYLSWEAKGLESLCRCSTIF